jgi:hypothetical protein
MLSGQGWTPTAGCRQFFYARYIDYFVTTNITILLRKSTLTTIRQSCSLLQRTCFFSFHRARGPVFACTLQACKTGTTRLGIHAPKISRTFFSTKSMRNQYINTAYPMYRHNASIADCISFTPRSYPSFTYICTRTRTRTHIQSAFSREPPPSSSPVLSVLIACGHSLHSWAPSLSWRRSSGCGSSS